MWRRHCVVFLLHGVLIAGVLSASTTSWMFIQRDDDDTSNPRTVRHVEKDNEYMETTNCSIAEHRIANCPTYDKNTVFTGIYTGLNSAKKYLEAVSYQIVEDLEKDVDNEISLGTRTKLREIAEELEYQMDYLDEILTALYTLIQPSNYNQQYSGTTYRAHDTSDDGISGTSGYYAYPYQSPTNTGTRVLYTQPINNPASTSSAYYTFLQNMNPTYQQQTNPTTTYNQPLAVLVHPMY